MKVQPVDRQITTARRLDSHRLDLPSRIALVNRPSQWDKLIVRQPGPPLGHPSFRERRSRMQWILVTTSSSGKSMRKLFDAKVVAMLSAAAVSVGALITHPPSVGADPYTPVQ